MRLHPGIVLALVAAGGAVPAVPPGTGPRPDAPDGFDPPEVVLDGSEYCKLYPAFADVDGDGTTDLVAGTWRGRLLVFRNTGTDDRPAYAKPTWLDAAVPSADLSGVRG